MRAHGGTATVLLLVSLGMLGTVEPAAAIPPAPIPLQAPDALADCVELEGAAPEWEARLTQPTDTSVTKFEEWLQRPDGTRLEVTVYVPSAFAGPRPTILHYTPYSSRVTQVAGWEEVEGTGTYSHLQGSAEPNEGFGIRHCSGYFDHWTPFFLRRGYAYVTADIRGTGDSTGCYDIAGPAEQADGRAIVEWIASQSWSDGTVGMHGFSLDGLSQFATAIAQPEALKAIVPVSASDMYVSYRPGGIAFGDYLSMNGPPPLVRGGSVCNPDALVHIASPDGHLDGWWRDRWMPLHASKISAAVLYPVGNPADVVYGFGPMWTALERAGVPAKGIVGPWGHSYPLIDGWELHELRWFEHHLRGIDTGVMQEEPLTLIDELGNVDDRFASHLTTLAPYEGTLTRKGGSADATYTDRPGMSRAIIESDPSAHLRYVSEPLKKSQHYSGGGVLELTATIDQADTNFIAMLYVIEPDGSRRYVTRGYLDAQQRNGMDQGPTTVEPGVPVRYAIDLWPRHTLLVEGTRLELVLSSTDACFDCPWADAPKDYFPYPVRSDVPAATVMVHEGRGESRLLLPLSNVGQGSPGSHA